MKRPVVIAAANLAGALVALCLAACSGCGGPQKGSVLLSGDAGLCSTVETVHLHDGGYSTSFVPCNFTGVSP